MAATASPELQADFQAWKAVGRGGVAPTWDGYLSQREMGKTVAIEDTVTLSLYQDPQKWALGWSEASEAQRAATQKSFLKEPLPQRAAPRAHAKPYVFPQRERNENEAIDPTIQSTYQQAYDRLGETNASTTKWATSVLEKHGRALFMKTPPTPLSPLITPCKNEICHLHTSDMSGHVTLSFADAQEVIAKGWGERHRMSGTDYLHLGYTMVYVPRSVDEVEVFGKILQAGVEYCLSA